MKLSLDAAQSLVVGALLRSGVDADNAASVARALVSARAATGCGAFRPIRLRPRPARSMGVLRRARPSRARPYLRSMR